jgi:GNAT superfamily N-acetyltransferase
VFVCERFTDAHDASAFDSGEAELDDWLRKEAATSAARNITRTYVWHERGRVVAYYAVMPHTIDADDLPRRRRGGQSGTVPCYLIAKLALDRSLQGQSLGSQLLASAATRLAAGGDELGGRFIVVDALHERAASFYVHHGFSPLPGVEGRLVLAMKDVTDALAAHGSG